MPVVLERSMALGWRLGIFLEYLSNMLTWYPRSNFCGNMTFLLLENGNSFGNFVLTACEVDIFCRL